MAEVTANQEMSREEVATYLREFADRLDGTDTGRSGDQRGGAGTRGGTGSEREGHEDHEDDRRGESDDDSAERVREERTDAAEQLREDEDAGSSHDTTAESVENDAATRDGDARGDTTHEGSGHATGGKVTFMVGNESATINPPGTLDFEMAVESDSSLMASGTRETVAFELHWNSEEVSADDELDVH